MFLDLWGISFSYFPLCSGRVLASECFFLCLEFWATVRYIDQLNIDSSLVRAQMLIIELIARCSVFFTLGKTDLVLFSASYKIASIKNQMGPNLGVGENSLQAPELLHWYLHGPDDKFGSSQMSLTTSNKGQKLPWNLFCILMDMWFWLSQCYDLSSQQLKHHTDCSDYKLITLKWRGFIFSHSHWSTTSASSQGLYPLMLFTNKHSKT